MRMTADGLTPITPPEDETVRKRSVPNGFESGIFNRIGSTEYKNVGTWELDGIADVISIQQPVIFIIWLSTSSSTTSGDIRFTLKYGTVVVAGPTELSVSNIDTTAKRYHVSSHANLTTTDSGKPLQLGIECKFNGDGVMIEYGGYQEDSGVSFMCDAVKFKNYHAEKKDFCVEFSDAFRASVNDLYPVLFVDGMAVYDEDGNILERSISEGGNNLFKWKMNLLPGPHTFLVGIAYAKIIDINVTWNTQVSLSVIAEEEKGGIGLDLGDKIVLFILITGLLVFFISTMAILSARSSAKNIYARKSPIPDRYRFIAKKRMKRFQKRPIPVAVPSVRKGGKQTFRTGKKFKM